MKDKPWEIFTVKYQLPKFGTENEFLPEEHVFMVSTQGGIEDAKEACKKYHSNCKIVSVLDRMASMLDDKGELPLTKEDNGRNKGKSKAKK